MISRKIFTAAVAASTIFVAAPACAQLLGGASGGVSGAAPGSMAGGLNGNAGLGDGMTTIPPTSNIRTGINGTVNAPTVTTPPDTVARNAQNNANRAVGNADTRAGAALDNAIHGDPGASAGASANIYTQGVAARSHAGTTLNSNAAEQDVTRRLNQRQATADANGTAGAAMQQ